jgi:hypothetical protein
MAVLAGGFKIPDFGLGGRLTTVREAFETKEKYADIFQMLAADFPAECRGARIDDWRRCAG